MFFEQDKLYHVYNRSNETLFYSRDNYMYFLEKVKKHIYPFSDILAWCLMPNHFHFLLSSNNIGVSGINEKHRMNTSILSKNFGIMLSSYTQAINKQENRRGKLFSHNTKAICLNTVINNDNYAMHCFHYIHQNPYTAGLVKKLEDWEFSSFADYAEIRNGKLVNKDLAFEIINYDKENFLRQSYAIIDDKKLKFFL